MPILPKKEKNISGMVKCVAYSLITPIIKTKYCFLYKPFYYPGSPIPRYSLTCLFDRDKKEDAQFLKQLEKIAVSNGVETIGYLDEGLVSVKFQTKERIPLFSIEPGNKKPKSFMLQHDLQEGFFVSVTFDLNIYYNKKTQKKGFNFCPIKIIFHVDQENTKVDEVISERNSKSSGNRSKLKVNGIRNPKLQPGKKRDLANKLRSDKDTSKI